MKYLRNGEYALTTFYHYVNRKGNWSALRFPYKQICRCESVLYKCDCEETGLAHPIYSNCNIRSCVWRPQRALRNSMQTTEESSLFSLGVH